MKNVRSLFVGVLIVLLFSGCAVNLPFSHRVSYSQVDEAKKLALKDIGPISIKWVPPSFPDRVDFQGASGFVGGASRTRIPTGVGIANRILEVLDIAIGIESSSPNVLTISVVKAETKFKYSAAIHAVTHSIVWGSCRFEAEFNYNGKKWKETFNVTEEEKKAGGTSPTGLLEKIWDNIALQVVQNITQNL